MTIVFREYYGEHVIELHNKSSLCLLCVDGMVHDQHKGVFAVKIEMNAYIGEVEIKVIIKWGARLYLYANGVPLKKTVLM